MAQGRFDDAEGVLQEALDKVITTALCHRRRLNNYKLEKCAVIVPSCRLTHVLLWTVYLLTLMLTAQTVFLLECRQTDTKL